MNRQYKYDTILETLEKSGNKPETVWKVINQNRTITVGKSRNRRIFQIKRKNSLLNQVSCVKPATQ